MAEPLTIYKLTILYMLDKSEIPLTNTQIVNFFLEQDYTNYFQIQEAIGDLVDSLMIVPETIRNTTQYHISEAGTDTLHFLRDKITDGMKQDVRRYYSKNKWTFKEENYTVSNFRITENNNFEVSCEFRSDTDPVINLKFYVPTAEMANAICLNWGKKYEDIYAYLMDHLIDG